MKTRMNPVAAALLCVPLAALGIGAASAQTADSAVSAAMDPMCDYCADYTDAAASVGMVRSAYRPGVGYAAGSDRQADGEASRLQKVARIHLFKQPQARDR